MRYFKALFLASLWLVTTMPCAVSQQTIFNVPSADTTDKGHVYLEEEFQARPYHPDRYLDGTEYFAVGIGHHTDVEATLFNLSTPASHNISLGLGFKTAIPLLTKALPTTDLKVTVGDLVPISLDGQGVGDWGYTHLSCHLPKLKTRLTAGISAGTSQIFGRDVVSFIGGYEQPITKNFSLIGDWYSGTHNLGYFTPGFAYNFPKAYTLYLGYQIPNNPRVGRSGITFELAKLF